MSACLLSREDVHTVAAHRGCVLVQLQPLQCRIGLARGGDTAATMSVVAVDRHRWLAFDILRACTELKGGSVPDFTAPAGLEVDNRGLDGLLIARTMAACGFRPYWRGERTLALKAILATAGTDKTPIPFCDDRKIRTVLQAMVDIGLAEVELGPRGGWTEARLTWKPAARRRLTRREDDELDALATAAIAPA